MYNTRSSGAICANNDHHAIHHLCGFAGETGTHPATIAQTAPNPVQLGMLGIAMGVPSLPSIRCHTVQYKTKPTEV